MIAFTDAHQGIITALATAVIAVSAVATAFLTFGLARENRLLRKAGTEPEIVAYLMADPRYKTMINFVLANIGRGHALNVSFEFDADEKDFTAHQVHLGNTKRRKAVSVLPQSERIVMFFGQGHQLLAEPQLKPFKAQVRYENISGAARRAEFELDVAQFQGLITLGQAAEHETAEALKKIEKHLSAFASGLKRFKVETITNAEARKQATKETRGLKSELKRAVKEERAREQAQSKGKKKPGPEGPD